MRALGLCIVNVHWYRNSDGYLTIFTFRIHYSVVFQVLLRENVWINIFFGQIMYLKQRLKSKTGESKLRWRIWTANKLKFSFLLSWLKSLQINLFHRSSTASDCTASGVTLFPSSSTGNVATFPNMAVSLNSYTTVSDHYFLSKTFTGR